MPEERSESALVAAGIEASLEAKRGLLALTEEIVAAARLLVRTLAAGRTVFFCGNGGSASDAQHLACELQGRFRRERTALPAMALGVNPATLTAIANDYGYEHVFARELSGLGRAGDLLVALSTSGSSPNVLAALDVARGLGMATLALTGRGGGGMPGRADLCLRIPSGDTPRIQESHILVGHLLCELAEEAIFGRS